MISKTPFFFFKSFLKKKNRGQRLQAKNWLFSESLLILLQGIENFRLWWGQRGWAGHTSTKPTKTGKTISNKTSHQGSSILCVPGTGPRQSPNPLTSLVSWVSAICMCRPSLCSPPSCSLLRNRDLRGLQQKPSSPVVTGEREAGGGKDRGLIFLAPALLVRAGWLCPSVWSHSPGQTAPPSSPPPWVQELLLTLCPFRPPGGKSSWLLPAPEGDPIPF